MVKDKHPYTWQWINVNARNCVYEGIGAGTLKCPIGCSHHGERDFTINKGTVSKRCPRCHQVESWEHVIGCPGIDNLKEKFVKDLKNKLNKECETDEDNERVSWIFADTTSYLYQRDQI